MASVKEMVNISLENPVYDIDAIKDTQWNKIVKDQVVKKDTVGDHRERSVTFFDKIDDTIANYSNERTLKPSTPSPNYKFVLVYLRFDLLKNL